MYVDRQCSVHFRVDAKNTPHKIGRSALSTPKVHDLIIVGSGPAGYTAGVYAARAELEPILFEGTQFGGALMTTTEVENFPGFREGIMGPDLMEQMREQAGRFGADIRTEDVEELDLTGPIKTVSAGGAHAVNNYVANTVTQQNAPRDESLPLDSPHPQD